MLKKPGSFNGASPSALKAILNNEGRTDFVLAIFMRISRSVAAIVFIPKIILGGYRTIPGW
ncbi:hypothetical protein [Legionella worsleiensis]|uniref:Uncharacterized protein n=1 Tax=Legionella worsleiensis TaxID=45076 RepID=A0A0W1A6D0_9GAMM|nr:hypothetical protein [Legionella worsleiensis]KTD76841.1 hypothetical protein Lwor_2066 [Legionella worsleiensis]